MFIHKNFKVPFCVLLFLLSTFLNLHSKEKNNILWIYLEDVSGWFGCYGETIIETPNIDSLASKEFVLIDFIHRLEFVRLRDRQLSLG